MEGRQPSRWLLGIAWTAFVLMWAMAALIALSLTQAFGCDGGAPMAAPSSPAGRYCDAVDDYLGSGEPGELTTALLYSSPVLVLASVGAYGVWRRRRGMLVAVGAAASLLLVVHVTLAASLPTSAA